MAIAENIVMRKPETEDKFLLNLWEANRVQLQMPEYLIKTYI